MDGLPVELRAFPTISAYIRATAYLGVMGVCAIQPC